MDVICVSPLTGVWWKVCQSFSDKQQISDAATKGVANIVAETFVKGTKIVKKSNFKDHLTKSSTHATAVSQLTDDLSQTEMQKEAQTSSSSAPPQTTLHLLFNDWLPDRKLSSHRSQLPHFTVANAKSSSFYNTLVNFAGDILEVDIRKSYINDTSAVAMIVSLSESIKMKTLTTLSEPINKKKIRYYIILMMAVAQLKQMMRKRCS